MSWTTAADLRTQVQKRWVQGTLLREIIRPGELFPLRLTLKAPRSSDLSERFDDVRNWVNQLQRSVHGGTGTGYRLVWRTVRHRVIGTNSLPGEVWIDTLEDALGLINKKSEAKQFVAMTEQARVRMPETLPWLEKHPLRALTLAGDWHHLLDILAWLRAHPRPDIYMRQVDLPGIHSKFIENNRTVLAELLDCVLPPADIDSLFNRTGGFVRRYGFREKPLRVRFRILDSRHALLPEGDQDITVSHDTFARLAPGVSRVFITENEINFLTLPPLADSLVVFGAGYGFDMLRQAQWLKDKALYYWGDLDTHGFAILDQLRSQFPHAESFLMDRHTLMTHRDYWGTESEPVLRELSRLTNEERAVYDDLRWKRLPGAFSVRLEQERIPFGWVLQTLQDIAPAFCSP